MGASGSIRTLDLKSLSQVVFNCAPTSALDFVNLLEHQWPFYFTPMVFGQHPGKCQLKEIEVEEGGENEEKFDIFFTVFGATTFGTMTHTRMTLSILTEDLLQKNILQNVTRQNDTHLSYTDLNDTHLNDTQQNDTH